MLNSMHTTVIQLQSLATNTHHHWTTTRVLAATLSYSYVYINLIVALLYFPFREKTQCDAVREKNGYGVFPLAIGHFSISWSSAIVAIVCFFWSLEKSCSSFYGFVYWEQNLIESFCVLWTENKNKNNLFLWFFFVFFVKWKNDWTFRFDIWDSATAL